MEGQIATLKQQNALLVAIIQRFLHLDLDPILNATSPSSPVTIIAPESVGGLYKTVVESAPPGEQPKDKSKEKSKRAAPSVRKKPTIAPAPKRIAVRTVTTYQDYDALDPEACLLPEFRDTRYKAIAHWGLEEYLQRIQTKMWSKDMYFPWEVRLLNTPETSKCFLSYDDVEMLREGQRLFIQHTCANLPATSTIITMFKTPLLQYLPLEDVLTDLFGTIPPLLGYVQRSQTSMMLYKAVAVDGDVRMWDTCSDWKERVLQMGEAVVEYLTQRFRALYVALYFHNNYTEEFKHVPELVMLLANILKAHTAHNMERVLLKVLQKSPSLDDRDPALNRLSRGAAKDDLFAPFPQAAVEERIQLFDGLFDHVPTDVNIMGLINE